MPVVAPLFEEILEADDREAIPGARPVLSFHEGDDAEFLRRIESEQRERVELARRGVWHGSWAELSRPRAVARDGLAGLSRRFADARPILLPRVARGELDGVRPEIAEAFALRERCERPGGLARWLAEREGELPEGFTLQRRRPPRTADGRDVEKVALAWRGAGRRGVRDLWIKTGRLSDHPEDASMRLRLAFGREVDDDASADELRHELVAELTDALLPAARAATENGALAAAAEAIAGEALHLRGAIAYWNAPEGGARFHHDAFAVDNGQAGVCFVQVEGRTAWLALSVADLAGRVREFCECLADGELPWLVDELFAAPSSLPRLLELVADERRLTTELALPGCGLLGPLTDRGPEFTSFLADAGHALLLEAGDALLLPNHGLGRTAMHSVFCASHLPSYGISFALRRARPSAPDPPPPPDDPDERPDAREIRRRRRRSPRRRGRAR
jgi:hypothetical protein